MNASHTRAFAAFVDEPEAFASILPEIDRVQRMSNAWDDMLDNATRLDGSYEAARDRFNAESNHG